MARYAIANWSDRSFNKSRYLFSLGAYGETRVLVFADSDEDALDEAIDWVSEHAPGLLANESVQEEYERARSEGLDEEESQERAEIDTIRGGNSGDYLLSWEVQYQARVTPKVLASVGR